MICSGQISPRFGFAYQVMPKTVVRGGYCHLLVARGDHGGHRRRAGSGMGHQHGMLGSIDGGLTPYHTLDNPFPTASWTRPGVRRV